MASGKHNVSYGIVVRLCHMASGLNSATSEAGSPDVRGELNLNTKTGMHQSYIYCAFDGAMVKVGWSRGPHARVRELSRKRPGLQLVRAWGLGDHKSGFLLEQIIHKDVMGRKHRWDGEWYPVQPEDVVPRIDSTIRHWLRYWRLNLVEVA